MKRLILLFALSAACLSASTSVIVNVLIPGAEPPYYLWIGPYVPHTNVYVFCDDPAVTQVMVTAFSPERPQTQIIPIANGVGLAIFYGSVVGVNVIETGFQVKSARR
jgi:hypothetical protein